VPVDLDEDEATGEFRYRCPTTFRRKTLSAAAAAVNAVRVAPLLHAIADLLGIARALRAGVDSAHVEGALWHLGRVKIGPAHTDVWVVRGAAYPDQPPGKSRRVQTTPDPKAIDRMLEVMRWVQWLEVEPRHLVWMRAQRHWQWALQTVADGLNGVAMPPGREGVTAS
jgi:hypothetical protein